MKSKEIIEKDLLIRKIKEYFTLNPKATSVIIKTDITGPGRTSWKVIKEGGKTFKIIEVKTSKDKFILEAPDPVGGQAPAVQPPGLQPPQNSTQARQANIQQFGQLDLQTKLAQLSTGMMLNYDTVISTLAEIVKSQSQNLVQLRRALEAGLNSAPLDANQKKLVGNVLGVLTAMSNTSTMMSSREIKGRPILREDDAKKKDQEPEMTEPISPETQTGSEKDQSQKIALPKYRTEEQILMTKSLIGQTIRAADVEIKPEGGVLTLDLVSVSAPVEFKWYNSGKAVYVFKNRPYAISKEK